MSKRMKLAVILLAAIAIPVFAKELFGYNQETLDSRVAVGFLRGFLHQDFTVDKVEKIDWNKTDIFVVGGAEEKAGKASWKFSIFYTIKNKCGIFKYTTNVQQPWIEGGACDWDDLRSEVVTPMMKQFLAQVNKSK